MDISSLIPDLLLKPVPENESRYLTPGRLPAEYRPEDAIHETSQATLRVLFVRALRLKRVVQLSVKIRS